MLIDAALLNAAVMAALALRFDGQIPPRFVEAYFAAAPFYTLGMLLLMNLAGVNRPLWRYAGVPAVLNIARILFLGFFLAYIANAVPSVHLFPKSVVILSWVLATGLVLSSRLGWKIIRSGTVRRRRTGSRRILIAGAGDVGAIVAAELLRSDRVPGTPIGFVDDDPRKLGRRIESVQVLGTTFDIPRLIGEKKVEEVLIAAPSAPARLVRQIVRFCQEAGVECKTVPAFADYIVGKGALGQVREIQIEDLLGREPVSIDNAGIEERIHGRTVLVTGAGGSIGSELCRQLARFHPCALVAMDHCENRLCYLGLDLAEGFPELHVLYVVGDVRDPAGLEELFVAHRPDVVFHAAAHKHVHFLERTPREAILSNILGTRNVARAASAHGVGTFVFISTDKAVHPTSVMGASKRAGEILLQAMAHGSPTTFVAVRFGNVLGSEGSVLPIFKRQLARGGPLTVTHPDARRYFMTIPEASQLVIQAAHLGESGNVFVLDMGEPVRILDVAEQLIRISGLRPGIDVTIRFTGLRPGEKLEEELLTDSERARVTRHAKIFRWELDPVDPVRVERLVDQLEAMASNSTVETIREMLMKLVPEYQAQAVTPLPEELPVLEPVVQATAAPLVRHESTLKRLVDLSVSLGLLALAAPSMFLALVLFRATGQGRVHFVREERLGRNRRIHERRHAGRMTPIDRRGNDRRVHSQPGPTFVTYLIELEHPPQSRFQRGLAGLLRRQRLNRVLYLWNVARGQMSLVGPSARLLQEASFSQDWTATWIYSRRPGLIGPGDVFGGGEDMRLVELYDGYYSRFGGIRLEMETLLRSLPRLWRGAKTRQALEDPTELAGWPQNRHQSEPAKQEGSS